MVIGLKDYRESLALSPAAVLNKSVQVDGGGGLMRTAAAVKSFLANRQAQNLRPGTIDGYRSLLKQFAAAYPILPTTPDMVETFLARLVKAGRAEDTIHKNFTQLRAFFRWAADRYNIPNPAVKLRAPRVTKKLRPTLEPEEVWRIISQATTPRDRAILVLIADTGIRAGELCSLRKGDIIGSTIRVTGKTGQREVPISDDTRRLLVNLAANIGPDDHIFWGHKGPIQRTRTYDIVSRYMTLAGITGPKLGPHRLRHAFGKGYLVAGGDLRSLQQIMGHASITTTQQYTALTQGDIIAKHHQFTLLRSAQAAAQGSFLDKSGVLKEAEEILSNNSGR